jgi:uncharacterized membrane protein
LVSGLSGPQGLAFDAAGNLYIGQYSSVLVLPKATGQLFGMTVTQNTLATVATLGAGISAGEGIGLAFDTAGNLYVAAGNGGGIAGDVLVLPRTSGSLFGLTVHANTLITLVSGLEYPSGLAFDAAGNLYIGVIPGVDVLAKSTGTVFGVSVHANALTTLISTGVFFATGLAFDAAGDLFIANQGEKEVLALPQGTGTLFGVPVVQNTVATVASGMRNPNAIAFDPSGNLYTSNVGDDDVTELVGPSLVSTPLPNGSTGVSYSTTLHPSGGTAPYEVTLASGVLPPGLSLSSSGVISGVPTSTGTPTFTFTVEVTDSSDNDAQASFSIQICGGRFRTC